MKFSRDPFPESLHRLLNREPAERADFSNHILRREGRLTTRVRGSHVRVTVRLRRWWARLAAWTPDADRLDALCDWLECAAKACGGALKAAVVIAAACLLYLIVGALIHAYVGRLTGGGF
jgi:hypothetical protein